VASGAATEDVGGRTDAKDPVSCCQRLHRVSSRFRGATRQRANTSPTAQDGYSSDHAWNGGQSTTESQSRPILKSPNRQRHTYVVDAGDGVTRRIAEAGFNVRDVGTIFITHHHDDHTAGLGTLMSVAWDNQRTKPISVYGPPKTEDLVKAAVQRRPDVQKT
jgi:glyoxylase-like metal-dependent hydrolase (beta-lactamase superfamily II)